MGNHPLVKYLPFDQKGWNLKKWSPGKISSMASVALMNGVFCNGRVYIPTAWGLK